MKTTPEQRKFAEEFVGPFSDTDIRNAFIKSLNLSKDNPLIDKLFKELLKQHGLS